VYTPANRERSGEHRGEERAEDARAVAGDEPRGGGHGSTFATAA
jgi:hypothetical protein